MKPSQANGTGDGGKYSDQYCRYHKSWGYDIERCRILRKDIEKLIQRSHIQSFIQYDSQEQVQHNSQERDTAPHQGSDVSDGCDDTLQGVIS